MGKIRQMWSKARGTLLRRGLEPQDVDDVVQEAFLRLEAYRQAHALQSEEAVLITTALNISRDEARRRRRWAEPDGDFDFSRLIDPAPGAEEVVEARERLCRLQQGLQQLAPRAGRCLIAQGLDGLSYKEIAAQEGISPAAAQKQVARALLFLVEWMGEDA